MVTTPTAFFASMNRPPSRHILGVAAGLMISVGGALAAADPAPAAPASPTAPTKTKPAWVERLATESKKLAFWEKEKKQAEPASPPTTAAQPAAAKKRNETARKTGAPAAPAKPAATPPRRTPPTSQKPEPGEKPAVAEPPAEKKSLFSKLPSLPFVKKRGESEPEVASSPVPADSKVKPPSGSKPSAPAARGALTPTDPVPSAEAEPAGEKRSGVFDLGRLWPGGKKSEDGPAPEGPSEVAGRTSSTRGKPAMAEAGAGKPKSATSGAGKPGANPGAESATSDAPAAKPSFWDRMTAAITPKSNSEKKPATAAVPKGLPSSAPDGVDAATFVVTKDDSPFYTFGPQQATPPDAYLPNGTIVTLTQKNWGWATVRLGDGRSGVVDRSALRPAVLADLVPAGRPGDALMASLTPGTSGRQPTPNFILPAAEMPDLPTSGDAAAIGGNPLLVPFSPEDVTDPGQFPPLPEIPPLPEPSADDSDGGPEGPEGPEGQKDPAEAAPEPALPAEGPSVEPAPKPEAGE